MAFSHITQLQNILSNRKMLYFIDRFLTDNKFTVEVNGHISKQFH